MKKEELRESIREQRNTLAVTPTQVRQLNQNLIALLESLDLKNILAYHPLPQEVDILESLEWILKNRSLGLPKVENMNLKVYKVSDLQNQLAKQAFSILEPNLVMNLDPIPITQLSCVIVPGLVFDLDGLRLGYGGGYYDRFLSSFPAVKIGVCWDDFLQSDPLPKQAHDVAMDYIVTETKVFRVDNT